MAEQTNIAQKVVLTVDKPIEIRFSEVDIMNVVWHGSYPLYLEDAREAFGEKYGLSYQCYLKQQVFAPIVEMKLNYKIPLRYGMRPIVRITYRPTEAAKIIFDYEIIDPATNTTCLTAHTVQVFMDMNYNLMWSNPDFYTAWKKSQGLL